MEKYIILMDVSGDVTYETAKDENLSFIPMEYTLKDDLKTSYTMETEEVLKSFYDGQRQGYMTKTTQITPYHFEEYVGKYLESGIGVIYISLSSGLSNTYASALHAKAILSEKYKDVPFYPIDSLCATGGMGVICERALANLKAKMSIKDNAKDLEELSHNVRVRFMVEDLGYLKRGGRISGATAIVGTMLSIKPILTVNSIGKLETVAKKRGDKLAIKDIYQNVIDNIADNLDVIYIVHADNLPLATKLYELLKEALPNRLIKIQGLSPIIGAHTGPGMVAACYTSK